MSQILTDGIESYAAPPPVLDEEGRVLAAFEVVPLGSTKLGFLQDVVVRGGGMGTSQIDLASAPVGGVAKERDVHREQREEGEGGLQPRATRTRLPT